MSTAYISPYAGLDDGLGAQRGSAQCFQGDCVSDVVTVTASTSTPVAGSPHYTVPGGVGYLAIYLTAPGKVYAGPTAADRSTKAGVYPAGWWPIAVRTGDLVFITDL